MKKKILYFVLLTGLAGCDKLKDLGQISKNIDYTSTVDLHGLPGGVATLPNGGLSAYYPASSMATREKEYMKEYNTTEDKIDGVYFAKFTIDMKKPAGQNFDFMDSVKVYISATNMPEILAAYNYSIPKGQTSVELTRVSDNLKDYFIKDTIYMRVGGHFVGIPDSGAQISANTTLNLVANPLN